MIESHPIALQLRFLQTISEIATENNSTIIFPLPIELIRPFLVGAGAGKGGSQVASPTGDKA
jgi:hypothetical protein